MSEVGIIGLDLTKHVFQIHGANALGRPVVRKRLRQGSGSTGADIIARAVQKPRCSV